MSKREELLLLKDILDAGNKILKFSEGMNFQIFLNDEKTQDACIRNFEIMGEAAKYISEETKSGNPGIEWKKIYNYRNLLIHYYFGVNPKCETWHLYGICSNEIRYLKSSEILKFDKKYLCYN